MAFGIKLSTEAVETRKKLEEVCRGDNSKLYLNLKAKLDMAEAKGNKFGCTGKALDIINWMVFANEFMFLNKFFKAINLIEKEIEKYVEEQTVYFDEETAVETESCITIDKTNGLETVLENIEKIVQPIANQIIKKIEIELMDMEFTNNSDKKNYIENKINEYLETFMSNSQQYNVDMVNTVRDLVSLELSMFKLCSSMDDAIELLDNTVKKMNL